MAAILEEGTPLVRVAAWKVFPWLRHGFSTRIGGVSTVYQQESKSEKQGRKSEQEAQGPLADGDLNLGWTRDDDPAHVRENRRRLVRAVAGPREAALVSVRQVHSAVSLVVPGPVAGTLPGFVTSDGRAELEADGLMTAAGGVLLGIQTADCVPVFVVDTRLRAVANFHAGWRGTAARIVEAGVAKMGAEFGSRPDDLVAAIGPSIGACCYGVRGEVYEAFSSQFAYGDALFTRAPGPESSLCLDLWEANRRQLLDAGLAAEGIALVGECTGCAGLPGPRRYFSHRREDGFTGRMLNVIGLEG